MKLVKIICDRCQQQTDKSGCKYIREEEGGAITFLYIQQRKDGGKMERLDYCPRCFNKIVRLLNQIKEG